MRPRGRSRFVVGPGAAARALFATTAFTAAALVFLVQPMAAKQLLPAFGGAQNVWNTAVVFFQIVLLGGYALSHVSIRALGVRRQVLLQLAIAALVFFFIPFALGGAGASSGAPAALRVVVLLGAGVGVPYLAVTMASPALQRWYAELGLPDSDDPYFLYVASNAGSLLGLLAFPFLLEPNLATGHQQTAWAIGYAVYVAGLLGCAAVLWRPGARRDDGARLAPSTELAPPIPGADAWSGEERGAGGEETIEPGRQLRWVLIAAVPASLMLGVTNYITADIAIAPLFWTLPLALYLISFIVTFGRRARVSARVAGAATALVVAALALDTFGAIELASPWRMALHLAAMFAAAVLAHGWLYEDRPGARQLTLFYLLLATGGVIGGAFTALLAPALFDRVLEYPLLLVAVLVLRRDLWGTTRPWRARAAELVVAAGVVVAVSVGPVRRILFTWPEPSLRDALILGAPLLLLAVRRWGFTLAVAGVLMFITVDSAGDPLFITRSFYGVLRVDERQPGLVQLQQGTTLHGNQFRDLERRDIPTTYYSWAGPLGDVFDVLQPEDDLFREVGVVGLGAGTVATYGLPGQRFTYYEIDPAVIRVALSPEYFRYLSRTRSRFEIVRGDARLRLAEADDGVYGLLVLDAYASDAIPVHLLTVEALELYERKLAPGGVMALHISSKHLDLESVVAATAAAAALPGIVRRDPGNTRAHHANGALDSHWIVLARDQDRLAPLLDHEGWRVLGPAPPRYRWTDDFSNVAEALVWWN